MGLGGAGHIFDMISRLKQNSRIKTSAHNKFKEYMDKRVYVEKNAQLDLGSFTPEQIAQEKERIRRWARKKRITYYFSILLGFIFCAFVFYWIYNEFRS